MLRSLYISASGMLVQRRAMDVLTNNLANVETLGYKRDAMMTKSFRDVLIGRINDPGGGSAGIGRLSPGVLTDGIHTWFGEGPLENTGISTDLALAGDGFFVVETPQGLRFTRSGNFQVSSDGYLCTQEGYYVRGTAGRIRVGGTDFSVDTAGNITSQAGTARLQVVKFADNNVLRKVGASLYTGPLTAQNADCQVYQGVLEGSNVELAQEMVDMTSIQRNYETNQRVFSMIDGTLQKAVTEIGRV